MPLKANMKEDNSGITDTRKKTIFAPSKQIANVVL